MSSAILYKSEITRGEYWKQRFAERIPELDFRIWPDIGDPSEIKYLVAWLPPENMAEQFPNLEVVFSVGAGVDHFDLNAFPSNLKLVRMLDPELIQGMAEYVTMATLIAHRQLPAYIAQQQQQAWQSQPWVPAQKISVGLMGLGAMGSAVVKQLTTLGYSVNGWSRSQKSIAGVNSFAGTDTLKSFLAITDILVCMLPLTDSTQYILNADLFAALPKGASVINVGRGQHLIEQDLLEALNSGHIRSAVIDVLQQEPPDKSHPFWHHPNIIMTPHIAGVTSFESGCNLLLENIKCYEQGKAMSGEVKLSRGY